jgi:hypothetical protein
LTNRVTSSNQSFNRWYYVGFTYEGTTLVAYINGIRIGAASLTRQAPSDYGYALHYWIGVATSQNMGTNAYLNGAIGSYKIYNRALSRLEILQNYKAQRGRFGLQTITDDIALSLDASDLSSYQGSGTTWFDLSSNRYQGFLQNGPTFNSDSGGSIVFDRADDKVNFLSIDPLGGASGGTWEAWVRPGVYSDSPNTWRSIITTWNDPASGVGRTWVFDLRYRSWYFALRTTEVSEYPEGWEGGSSANNIPDNTWSHLVATYNSSDKAVKIYINGTLVATTTKTNGGNISYKNSNENLQIGVDRSTTAPFDGRISIVRLYRRALSATEVSRNYNADRQRFGL